jgi:hypothetical protein
VSAGWILVVVSVIGLVGPARTALAGFRGLRERVPLRPGAHDRVAVTAGAAGAAAVLVVARQLGDWDGPVIAAWWGLVLVAAACAVGIALRWPALPWRHPRRRGGIVRDAVGIAVSVLSGAAAAVLL